MDKFIIKVEPATKKGFKSAIIDLDTHERLKQVSELTGVGISKLIAEAIKFSFDRLEVQE